MMEKRRFAVCGASLFCAFHALRIFDPAPPYNGIRAGGEGIKTVIYLDVLLLVNFAAAYFLLTAAGALAARRARFVRMLAASALAALSALILFAPELPYPLQLAYKLATAGAVTAAAFGCRPLRRWLAVTAWYACLNLLLAGLALLVILRTGTNAVQTANLAVYLRVSPLLLLGLSGLCCAAAEAGLRTFHPPQRPPQTIGLEFALCGAPVRLRAVLDTGCHIRDPLTCLPVLVVSYPDAAARLPRPVAEYLQAWFAGDRTAQLPPGAQLRVLPCQTAAQQGLLPGFAVGSIGLITENGLLGLGRSAVAFAPQSFGSDAYEALYGEDFL